MRFDNGSPFGDPNREVTPLLALWLIGLDIRTIYNDPFRPQQNAKVERHQGTLGNWVDPPSCRNYEHFTQRLGFAQNAQWTSYPTRTLKGKTRQEVFEQLKHSGRDFLAREFNFNLVKAHLQKFTWARKISSTGVSSIYNVPYQAGFHWRGKQTLVKYDPEAHHWQFWDSELQICFKSLPIKNINSQALLNLP